MIDPNDTKEWIKLVIESGIGVGFLKTVRFGIQAWLDDRREGRKERNRLIEINVQQAQLLGQLLRVTKGGNREIVEAIQSSSGDLVARRSSFPSGPEDG